MRRLVKFFLVVWSLAAAFPVFALDPVPITWSGSSSGSYAPQVFCAVNGLLAVDVHYDTLTSFACLNISSNGRAFSGLTSASCPTGYFADFRTVLCQPNPSVATDSAVVATAMDNLSQTMSSLFTTPALAELGALWSIGFLTPMAAWLVAWCCAQIVSMFRVK